MDDDSSFIGPDFSRPERTGTESTAESRITTGQRRLRPFGYLGLSLLWLIIFAVVIFVVWIALPSALISAMPLSDSPAVAQLSDAGEFIAFLIAISITSVIFGFALLFLPTATFSLMMLALLFFGRSLQSSYAREKLSITRWTAAAIGPVRIGGGALTLLPVDRGPIARWKGVFGKAAISLIPVRRTRVSSFRTTAMIFSLVPSGRMIFSSFVFGIAYLVTIIWLLWPVTGALVFLSVSASVALAILGIWMELRAVRREIRSWTVRRGLPVHSFCGAEPKCGILSA